MTVYHKLSGLNRNILSSCRGQSSEIIPLLEAVKHVPRLSPSSWWFAVNFENPSPWQCNSNLMRCSPCVCVFAHLSPFYKNISHIGLGPIWSHFNLITSSKTQMWSHSEVWDLRILGVTIQFITLCFSPATSNFMSSYMQNTIVSSLQPPNS